MHAFFRHFLLAWAVLSSAPTWGELGRTDHPDRHTFYVHHYDGLVRRSSPGVFVWFAGTGGTAAYGVEGSMAPILRMHHDEDWDAVAAENPLYGNRDGSAAERLPILERYGTLDAQLEWMYRTLEDVVAACTDAGDPRKRLFVGGRSMGAGLLMEGLYRYVRGDARAAVFARIEGILVYGLHGHTASDVDTFMRTEYLMHEQLPGQLDALVLRRGPIIYRDMGFAPEDGAPVTREGIGHIPRVVAVKSVRDEYIFPWEYDATYSRLMRRLPQVQGHLISADTAHDISQSGRYQDIHELMFPVRRDPYWVTYRSLERLRPVVDTVVRGRGGMGNRPAAAPWTRLSLPSPEAVRDTPMCQLTVTRSAHIPDATLRAFYPEFFAIR